MNEKGDMYAEYYSYRVEFQLRGAGHIHGTIWINWDLMEEKIEKRKEEHENKNKNKENVNETYLDVKNVKKAFESIKEEKFGIEGNEEEDSVQRKALAAFIDKFVSCSLKDPSTVNIVRSVNMHNHTKPCQQYGPPCRFRFPRFPCMETII